MTDLMYTPLESVFHAAMQREGRNVVVYTSGSEFQAFMRRNDDGDNFEDRIMLYYHISAPVVQGSIIQYGNKLYILVNRETEENYCYYKSSGLACNGVISINEGTLAGIPCYAYDMSNGLGDDGKTLSTIGGSMEFITESNALSRSLVIGNTFNEFGRTWEISNIYFKDGILHVIAKVRADKAPKECLEIKINNMSGHYKVGDTTKLEASCYLNTYIIPGTITWRSSDSSIASIDGEGKIEFHKQGIVKFTAYWVEKNYSQSTESISISKDLTEEHQYTAKIKGSKEINAGYSRTYTAHLYDADGLEADGKWKFEAAFDNPDFISTNQVGNKFTINTCYDDSIIKKELTITATETVYNISTLMVVTVCELNY